MNPGVDGHCVSQRVPVIHLANRKKRGIKTAGDVKGDYSKADFVKNFRVSRQYVWNESVKLVLPLAVVVVK